MKAPIQKLNPKESEVMKQLRFYLDRRFGELGWVHIPNEQMAGPKRIGLLRASGLKKGFPDILIFEGVYSPRNSGYEGDIVYWGMAIEVKRERGGKLSPEQAEYLDYFSAIGWATAVGRGYQDTINKIEEVYGK